MGGAKKGMTTMERLPNISFAGKWSYTSIPDVAIIPFYSPIKLQGSNAQGIVVAGWSYAGWSNNQFNPTNIAILAPNSNGTLSVATDKYVRDSTTNGAGSIIVTDFNGDGRDDIFLGAHNESPLIDKSSTAYLSQADGTFKKVPVADATQSHSAQIGDLNGQKIIVTGGYGSTEPYYTFNPTNQNFDVRIWGNSNGHLRTSSSAVADLDGDGKSELVLGEMKSGPGYAYDKNQPYKIGIYKLTEDALGSSPAVLLTPYFNAHADRYVGYKSAFPGLDHIYRVWVHDFNYDGRPDILAGTCIWEPTIGRQKSKLQMFQNNGSLNFSDVTDSMGLAYNENSSGVDFDLQLFDIDQSGIDTIFSGCETYQSTVSTLEKNANYLLVNDGTGKLYSALHSEFEVWSAKVISYTKSLSIGSVISIAPKFIPVISEDSKLNFVADLAVRDWSTTIRSRVFINIETNYDLKSDFIQNIKITDRNNSTLMRTWAGSDIIYDANANSLSTHIDGGLGSDTSVYSDSRNNYILGRTLGSEVTVKSIAKSSAPSVNDILASIERVDFTDGDLIFDVTSVRAPAAYRLYGGAFDRTPDEGGFRYWTQTLDSGVSLHDVAASFIVSKEFTDRYGSSQSNAAFVDALYLNVLNRPGEAAGVAYWNDVLNKKLADRADVLVSFTQLPEYVGLSLKDIENGYWVV